MVDLGEVIQTMDNGSTQRGGGVAAAITYRNFASSCWDRGKVVVTTHMMSMVVLLEHLVSSSGVKA